MAAPDPRIKAFIDANKTWASSPEYKAPIPFLQMQKGGRARPDGTVIVCEFCFQLPCSPSITNPTVGLICIGEGERRKVDKSPQWRAVILD